MKHHCLLVLLCICFWTSTGAQQLEKAKEHLNAGRLSDAKKAIDDILKDVANQKNGDAWYIKTKVYNAIAADAALSKQYPAARTEAFNALKKYTETDTRLLISLQIDGYKPVNEIYTGWYQDAANSFNLKQYERAYESFNSAITVSSFMTQKGWINLKLDTNSVLYAGVAAEKLNRYDDAVKYYGQLVTARVKGEGFVEIYKWVANHYYEKKDYTQATKYVQIGKEVYPSDPFWASLELDMTRVTSDKKKLFAQYEKTIATEPTNHLYRYNYAVELYQYAYHIDLTKRPANSEVLINTAAEQIKQSLALKPDYIRAQLFGGQIWYNRGVDYLNKAKLATQPAEKQTLKKNAMTEFDKSLPYFQTVEQLSVRKGQLSAEEKADLKEAYDLLITIYDQKGEKEKVKEYETKLTGVEKAH